MLHSVSLLLNTVDLNRMEEEMEALVNALQCLFTFEHSSSLLNRMEEEMEALEKEELNISANEEVILKRLKEVERTAEDIIKVDLSFILRCTAY